MRQRERKKQGHVAKRRPQVVENHHDDCGEDFSTLGDDFFTDVILDENDDYLCLNEDTYDIVWLDRYLGMCGSDFTPQTFTSLSETVRQLSNRFAHSAGPGMVRHRVAWIGIGMDDLMRRSKGQEGTGR